MSKPLRDRLRDFVALVALVLIGLVTLGVILSQQQAPYPEWIPFLGDERFELQG